MFFRLTEKSVAFTPKNRHLVEPQRHRQVIQSVAVEIRGRQVDRNLPRLDDLARIAERVPRVDKYVNGLVLIVEFREIRQLVVIEIRHRDTDRIGARFQRDPFLERAVPVAFEIRQGVFRAVGNQKVEVPIRIEIIGHEKRRFLARVHHPGQNKQPWNFQLFFRRLGIGTGSACQKE